jgi:hypothetical protein
LESALQVQRTDMPYQAVTKTVQGLAMNLRTLAGLAQDADSAPQAQAARDGGDAGVPLMWRCAACGLLCVSDRAHAQHRSAHHVGDARPPVLRRQEMGKEGRGRKGEGEGGG